MSAQPVSIARPSVASLLLVTKGNGHELSTATGFVAERDGTRYLVTNWHVVAGRRTDTGAPLSSTSAVPDEIAIAHNVAGQLGTWEWKHEPLYDHNGEPLWFEHPSHGRRVDVVALPLTDVSGMDVYPYDPASMGPGLAFGVGGFVTIVGFPFGITGGGAFGVWVQGAVATEPAIDFNDLPAFLVDSRTRQGQSGSPVLIYSSGGAVAMEDGSTAVIGGPAERFLGVYSGRITAESDLGIVWKAQAVVEIIDGRQPGPLPQVGGPP